MFYAWLGSLLFLGSSGAVPADAKRKASPFEEMAGMVLFGGFLQYMEVGAVPDLASWAALKAPEIPPLDGFPRMLLDALDSPPSKDHQSALHFVLNYTGVARTSAYARGKRDLESVAHRTYAPHTKAILAALTKSLTASELKRRSMAATSLLAFEPANPKAKEILAEAVGAKDPCLREEVFRTMGMLHLSSAHAVNGLIGGLSAKEPAVRESAANALRQIGCDAKAALPALVHLLKSGDAAYGRVDNPFALLSPRTSNLALLAISEMGPDAHSAVPAILEMFGKATGRRAGELFRELPEQDDQAEKVEFLTCLARIGPAAKEGIATIEQAMKSDNTPLRVTAACAMLCVVPSQNRAVAVINEALRSKDKKIRARALRACAEIGPRSTKLVAALLPLLGDEDSDCRHLGPALAHIGPGAADAIPALEKLLTNETRDFTVHQGAAYALAQIGKASVPALLRATAQTSAGRDHAIAALGLLGKNATPEVVQCLTRIVTTKGKDEEDPCRAYAALALGRLGEHARSARPVLEAVRQDDEALGFFIERALMEIPR